MDKKIVYESRVKFIILVSLSSVFVIGSFLGGQIWSAMFFLVLLIGFTYPFLDPRKKVICVESKQFKEQINKDFELRLRDNGIFSYSENGFTVNTDGASRYVQWHEVQTIFGYKKDLMTTDLVCMDVFCDNAISFSWNEETPGWFVFVKKLNEQFNVIDPAWEFEIQNPAFVTKLTLVYNRENRTLEQVMKVHYKN
jgi:hypothetical protein